MNKSILAGRLTRDPAVSYVNTKSGEAMAVARFSLAVDRRYVKKNSENREQQTADFISCVCLGKLAEFTEKYLHQGSKILLEGRIQTGSYVNKNGQRVYTTDVLAQTIEFAESRKTTAPDGMMQEETTADGFASVTDSGEEGGLPFG